MLLIKNDGHNDNSLWLNRKLRVFGSTLAKFICNTASFDEFLVNVQNMLQQNAVVVSIYLFSSWANRHPNTCKLNPVGDLKTYQTLFLMDNVGKLFDTFDQSGKVSSFKTTKCQKYETNLGKHNPMWRLKVGLLILLRL